jgi:hypothetical protein
VSTSTRHVPQPGVARVAELARSASKQRARRRGRAGGAVMFIVAMTLAVIAMMGIYALQMASTEVKTAGYIRQQLQTQYLSVYGVAAATQALNNNPQVYATVLANQPDTGCFTLYQISTQATANPQSKACHRAGSGELGAQVVPVGFAPATLLSPFVAPGGTDLSVGTVGLPTFPDFFVEVTDPNPKQPPPGYASNSSSPVCFEQVTASAMGLTPTTAVSNGTDTFIGTPTGFLSEGFEMARARIVFGPVICTGTN